MDRDVCFAGVALNSDEAHLARINRLEFKLIKRGVNPESLLRCYHVELRRSGKDPISGCCPIHHGDGLDALPRKSGSQRLFEAAQRLRANDGLIDSVDIDAG
jgi:hypothetical protein